MGTGYIPMDIGTLVSIASIVMNIILVAVVTPAVAKFRQSAERERQVDVQLALLRYQVGILMENAGVRTPAEPQVFQHAGGGLQS